MEIPMVILPVTDSGEPANAGREMYALMTDLFPLCRSITGNGTLETLQRLQRYVPIAIQEVVTGTKVFDWTIPKEWNIREAYIKNSKGEKIVDFANNNLHVVNYSTAIQKIVSNKELKEHLHTLPEHPEWIPYRTTYYQEDWGFCIRYNQYKTLDDEWYEVFIDSTLEPGRLVYGELVIHGETTDEVLISTHICHPSLCNDNLSGICVATFLAQRLLKSKTRYTYRFLFIPGTIGAIAWLFINQWQTHKIRHGIVAVLLGDGGNFTYKKSRQGNAEIDHVIQYVLEQHSATNKIKDFSPYGYDERQFCSPGFNLPVGCLTRTPYGEFPEYHTSADNLDFVKLESLEGSLRILEEVVNVLELNKRFFNRQPKCEPQLGKRGLYDNTGGRNDAREFQLALLWVLNYSDGEHSLLDIAVKASLTFKVIADAAEQLRAAKLLEEVPNHDDSDE